MNSLREPTPALNRAAAELTPNSSQFGCNCPEEARTELIFHGIGSIPQCTAPKQALGEVGSPRGGRNWREQAQSKAGTSSKPCWDQPSVELLVQARSGALRCSRQEATLQKAPQVSPFQYFGNLGSSFSLRNATLLKERAEEPVNGTIGSGKGQSSTA